MRPLSPPRHRSAARRCTPGRSGGRSRAGARHPGVARSPRGPPLRGLRTCRSRPRAGEPANSSLIRIANCSDTLGAYHPRSSNGIPNGSHGQRIARHRHDGRSVVRLHAVNPEAAVDGEPAKCPVAPSPACRARPRLRERSPVGRSTHVSPFSDDGGRPRREDVLDPVRTRPVRQRDHEPVVGREGHDRRFVRSSRLPADVSITDAYAPGVPAVFIWCGFPKARLNRRTMFCTSGDFVRIPTKKTIPIARTTTSRQTKTASVVCPHGKPPPRRTRSPASFHLPGTAQRRTAHNLMTTGPYGTLCGSAVRSGRAVGEQLRAGARRTRRRRSRRRR